MKPVALVDAKTQGSLGDAVQTVKMGFDENSIEHLLMLLTDLYSDKPLAVIREYSTNARDEHVKHGVKRPIEVTLPNAMNPFFKVRDYAAGMSVETISNVYSKYGASTKRESNDFNGMLGIGGKSALTYTTQFTVTSIHEGTKIIVIVSRVGQRAQMQIVSQTPTTEPSGVEITVPVKADDVRSFVNQATFLFKFWDEGIVLLNGKAPERVDLKMITDRIGTTTGLGQDYIVMGGVPYPVESRLFDGRNWNGFNVVAFVDIGDVAITPSREALMHNTQATDDTIALVRMELAGKIAETVQADINEADSRYEAWVRRQKWQSELGRAMPAVDYKGEAFPTVNLAQKHRAWNSQAYRGSFYSGYGMISVDQVLGGVIVTGFDADTLTPRNKEKIRHWKETNSLNANFHLIVDEGEVLNDTIKLWMPKSRIVTWEDIKAIRLPKKVSTNPAGPRKQPTIDVFDANGLVTATDIDKNKTILYVSPAEKLTTSGRVVALYKAFPNVQLVELGKNRWERFTRQHPGAIHVQSFLRKKVSDARDMLTKDDLRVKGIHNYTLNSLRGLASSEILDEKVKFWAEVANGGYKSATIKQYDEVATVAQHFGLYMPDFPRLDVDFGGYPLLRNVYSAEEKKHMVIYLNAVYTANQEKENKNDDD